MTLEVQFLTMISMVFCGIYLGAMYDTFRRFSPYWKRRKVLTYFLEILFWLVQTAIIFYILYRVNDGEVRFYIFLAGLLGFSMYQALVKSIYLRMLEQIIRVIASIYRFLSRMVEALLIKPIIWMFTVIMTIVLWLIHTIWKILIMFLRILLLPLKCLGKLIYHLLPKSFQNYLHQLAGFYSKMKNIVMRGVKKFRRR